MAGVARSRSRSQGSNRASMKTLNGRGPSARDCNRSRSASVLPVVTGVASGAALGECAASSKRRTLDSAAIGSVFQTRFIRRSFRGRSSGTSLPLAGTGAPDRPSGSLQRGHCVDEGDKRKMSDPRRGDSGKLLLAPGVGCRAGAGFARSRSCGRAGGAGLASLGANRLGLSRSAVGSAGRPSPDAAS